MSPELQKQMLQAKVAAMVSELVDRIGPNGYQSFDLTRLSIEDLEQLRKDLHETLYAPPPRGGNR